MSDTQNQQPDHILAYWIRNLVGNSPLFSTNLLISVLGGSLYSFGIVSSHYMLLIFGVISPLIFTLCLYFSIRNINVNDTDHNFPKFFTTKSGNLTFMILDMSIIVGLAIFIQLDFLNYFFFRFLQTVLFPVLMLFLLRFIYILQFGNMNDKLEE